MYVETLGNPRKRLETA